MHLWPSMKLRDSFKVAYLKQLDWNLHRMNTQKQQQRKNNSNDNQESLLDGQNGEDGVGDEIPSSKTSSFGKAALVCREILMVLSCCYCCFCCGGVECFNLALDAS
ncbi:hypothetical protein Tsubulata_019722 [Turnera subulata]|uniref:Uncharacterized protein n=1 Tax=Turnera subulata TaxID=218843 RepID=A0A9Q0JMU3_9ROSI|nr:hypothetical protein Tsubulata_019722 [Turnera subulata]